MNAWVWVVAIPWFFFCASLGPILNWQHEQWLKSLKEKRDDRNAAK